MYKFKLAVSAFLTMYNSVEIENNEKFLNASKVGNIKVIKKLLKDGVNINTQDGNKETALMQAARYGNKMVVELLIENKADLNMQNNSGKTALLLSVIHDKYDIAQQLVKSNADATIEDHDGNSVRSILSDFLPRQK